MRKILNIFFFVILISNQILAQGFEPLRRVDELDLADPLGPLPVVENPDIGGDAGVVEHVGRQRHDRVDPIMLEQPASDLRRPGLRATGEERGAVQHNRGPPATIAYRPHLGREVLQE